MQNRVIMNHVWLTPQIKLMTDGLNFPQMVISSILLTEVDKEKNTLNLSKFVQQKLDERMNNKKE